MRLDKFLKVSRLIKRRTVAKEVCDAARVTVNGRPAKAGHELKTGDVIGIGYGRRFTEVEVLLLTPSISAAAADTMYRVIKESEQPLN
ncbi:MAG: RNA-binding S4 domain-containing protein [Clostridiales bacterium]|nr:RNA-binding S4 domain-containing protein [Clostridiales bacterium]